MGIVKKRESGGIVKKTLATIFIGMGVFIGGVTSCHYTVSHYHYSKKNYESCFWHAYQAGKGISAYKPNAYRYAFDIALKQSKYTYNDPEEYYQYYVEDSQKKVTKVMHLQDKEISRAVFRFDPKYFSDHVECEFFRMHYGYYNGAHPLKFQKKSVIYGDEVLGYERPQVARRFMHMLDITPEYKFIKTFGKKKLNANNKINATVLKNYVNGIVQESSHIMKREDYLLHVEYGLVCADVAQTVQNYHFNQEQLVKYMPESMEGLYNTIDEIITKKLTPQVEKHPNMQKVITHLENVLQKR